MGEDPQIRRAVVEDTMVLTAFNRELARETEGKELAPATVQAGVAGLLARPQYGFYLVAEAGRKVVGSLLVTFEWSDWRNGLIWWVQSVYVQPNWRRRGVYRRLYRYLQKLAVTESRICGFRLYVEQGNAAAQRTYEALGMQRAPYWIYEDWQD